jgi:multidrug efflux pump subunit AcrA (membrane-fusion protein)
MAITSLLAACGKKEKSIKPEIKSLTEAVYASGNIFPKNEYLVYANADGLLNRIFVQAGDQVSLGQPLFKVDSDIQDAKRKTSGAIYHTALDNLSANSPALSEARTQLESAKVKMQNDSVNYNRFKNLMDNNATSRSEYDKALLNYSISKNDFEARKNSVEKLKRQLFVDLQNAENQYSASTKEGQNYLVKALFNGTVYEIYKERGEAVRKNDPVAMLGDNSQIYLKLSVDELDIEKIKIGQEVLVKVDLYKDRKFNAVITRIHRKMNIQDQSFRVDAEFTGEKPTAYYGLTVEANVVIARKTKVLTIPKNMLAAPDSLWVKTSDGTKKIRIKKGIEDFDHVEVLEGIDRNSEIVSK